MLQIWSKLHSNESEYIFGNDDDAYPAYLVRNTTHVFQMLISGLHSLLWMIAPIVQLLAFLTVTPRFWMQGAWENVSFLSWKPIYFQNKQLERKEN
jgi:hypothetical protein